MNNKLIFAIKLLVTLAIIAGIGCIALDAVADTSFTVRQVQARGGLNVREAPGIEFKAVYLLEDTETVIVLEERDGWVLVAKNISRDMVLGWVCGVYLK